MVEWRFYDGDFMAEPTDRPTLAEKLKRHSRTERPAEITALRDDLGVAPSPQGSLVDLHPERGAESSKPKFGQVILRALGFPFKAISATVGGSDNAVKIIRGAAKQAEARFVDPVVNTATGGMLGVNFEVLPHYEKNRNENINDALGVKGAPVSPADLLPAPPPTPNMPGHGKQR